MPATAPSSPLPAVLLVATHLFPFVLLPAAMYTFWLRAGPLREAGAHSPFLALLGISFIMVAVAGEMGWHVGQVGGLAAPAATIQPACACAFCLLTLRGTCGSHWARMSGCLWALAPAQGWVYVDNYSVLNCFFYFFLVLGTSLWAVGVRVRGLVERRLRSVMPRWTAALCLDLGLFWALPLPFPVSFVALHVHAR